MRAVLPTEVPLPRPEAVCARCGVLLVTIHATDNLPKHACDGNYEWLDGR